MTDAEGKEVMVVVVDKKKCKCMSFSSKKNPLWFLIVVVTSLDFAAGCIVLIPGTPKLYTTFIDSSTQITHKVFVDGTMKKGKATILIDDQVLGQVYREKLFKDEVRGRR